MLRPVLPTHPQLVEHLGRRTPGRPRGGANGPAGAVFHSVQQGGRSVYTGSDYAQFCAQLGVTQAMGAIRSSADNALAESFSATLEREILQDTMPFR